MINSEQARRIAYQYLKNMRTNIDTANIVIVDHATSEEPFGWVFFYNDRRYIETRDGRYALSGNLPLVVLRNTGELSHLPWDWGKDRDANIRAFAAKFEEASRSSQDFTENSSE